MANLDSGWEFFRDYLGLLKLVSFLTKRRFLLLHRNHHCHLCCTYSHRVGRSESRGGESSPFSYPGERISHLIICMKKLLDSDWLRTMQFFLNIVQKRGNWMQKKGNKASILTGQWTKKFTDSQSNLLFSNQARALDGAIFSWLRDTHAFLLLNISNFYMYIVHSKSCDYLYK